MKIILPLLVLTVAGLVSAAVILLKPEPARLAPSVVTPVVEVVDASPAKATLVVTSQGTVQPRVQTTLVAEVSGRVIEVSPRFRAGGFFEEDDVLLRLDPSDHEAALAMEEAALAQADYTLELERAQAEQAALDWKDLGTGTPSPLALRVPQIRQAEAVLKSAQARVDRARRDLERCTIRAPFTGRILETRVDLGGYVTGSPPTPVAEVYAIDAIEVRLPLTPQEKARLNLPDPRPGEPAPSGPPVTLLLTQGRDSHTWQGAIIRTEAAYDSRSRLIYVVAEVTDPYARDPEQPARPALKPGMFLEARIQGKTLEQALAIPRHALREGNTVLVADADDILQRRQVSVASADVNTAILDSGLQPGDRVIVSPLEYAIPGSPVQLTKDGR